jgi:hypothetical protein
VVSNPSPPSTLPVFSLRPSLAERRAAFATATHRSELPAIHEDLDRQDRMLLAEAGNVGLLSDPEVVALGADPRVLPFLVRNPTLTETGAVALVARSLRTIEAIAAGAAMGDPDTHRHAIQDLDAARGGLPAGAIALFDVAAASYGRNTHSAAVRALTIGLECTCTPWPVEAWCIVGRSIGWSRIAQMLFAHRSTTDALVQEILLQTRTANNLMLEVCRRSPIVLTDPTWRAALLAAAWSVECVDLLAHDPHTESETRTLLERLTTGVPGRLVTVLGRPGIQRMLRQHPTLAISLLQHSYAEVREAALLATGTAATVADSPGAEPPVVATATAPARRR